eukprot:CAMPEP_0174260442 /NCGR_PEP_ID=MMETSP0439-20130205/9714_1 /TAXON_ID=0 /ORGANISM="Stereomyxa ramosa, Strain Chinc5" /LENGTH=1427 /DNA_ID=CAMNT_0015344689 /DNA_START=33 /DNA_END=4316 /DNA_ORIENTATION=+
MSDLDKRESSDSSDDESVAKSSAVESTDTDTKPQEETKRRKTSPTSPKKRRAQKKEGHDKISSSGKKKKKRAHTVDYDEDGSKIGTFSKRLFDGKGRRSSGSMSEIVGREDKGSSKKLRSSSDSRKGTKIRKSEMSEQSEGGEDSGIERDQDMHTSFEDDDEGNFRARLHQWKSITGKKWKGGKKVKRRRRNPGEKRRRKYLEGNGLKTPEAPSALSRKKRSFFIAVQAGKIDEVQSLMTQKNVGVYVNGRDALNVTPLIHAVSRGHYDIVELLLECGAAVNAVGPGKRTALHWAALFGYIEIMELLLEHGADIDAVDEDLTTPLQEAAFNGAIDGLNLLLMAGADPHSKDRLGNTALHKAAVVGNGDVIQRLLQAGVDIDAVDEKGGTPLHNAIYNDQYLCTLLLIGLGADIDCRDKNGNSCVRFAVFQKAAHNEGTLLQLLLRSGADCEIEDESGVQPIHVAAFKGNTLALTQLLEQGISPHTKAGHGGMVPLHYAASGGNLSVVLMLLGWGADINVKDYEGNTPLHYAVARGHLEVSSFLLFKRADVNCTNVRGKTPLRVALDSPILIADVDLFYKFVDLLILKGADPDIMDKTQVSPNMVAEQRGVELMALTPATSLEGVGSMYDTLFPHGGGEGGGGRSSALPYPSRSCRDPDLKIDLNDVQDVFEKVMKKSQKEGNWNSYLNILRHFLLLPSDSNGKEILNSIETVVHRTILCPEENIKDSNRLMKYDEWRDHYDILMDNKKKLNKEQKLELKRIKTALAEVFPGTKKVTGRTNMLWKMPTKKKEKKVMIEEKTHKKSESIISKLKDKGKDKLKIAGEEKADVTVAPPPFPTPMSTEPLPDGVPPPPPPPFGMAGPPPPGGGPPPPPPPGGMFGPPALNRPKVRRFFWDKIPPMAVAGTIFEGLYEQPDVSYDEDAIQDLFKIKKKTKGGDDEDGEKKAKKPTINFIDPKNAMNIEILLKKTEITGEEFRQGVLADSEALEVDFLKSMMKSFPTEEELKNLYAYTGDRDALPPCEDFFYELRDIPTLGVRLNAIIFTQEYEEVLDHLTKTARSIKIAVHEVKNNKKMKKLLKWVLDIGNYLNGGYFNAQAKGFKISSLSKIKDMKSTDLKTDLLAFLIEQLEEHDPHLLKLAESMPNLGKEYNEQLSAMNESLNHTVELMNSLENLIETQKPVSDDDTFFRYMKSFVKQSSPVINDLRDEIADIGEDFRDLAPFCGEAVGTDAIKIISDFCDELDLKLMLIEKEREAERTRKAKKKKEKEMAKKRAKQAKLKKKMRRLNKKRGNAPQDAELHREAAKNDPHNLRGKFLDALREDKTGDAAFLTSVSLMSTKSDGRKGNRSVPLTNQEIKKQRRMSQRQSRGSKIVTQMKLDQEKAPMDKKPKSRNLRKEALRKQRMKEQMGLLENSEKTALQGGKAVSAQG